MNKKKISLLVALFVFSQQVSCTDNQDKSVEFPEYTTNQYAYNKNIFIENSFLSNFVFGKTPDNVSIADKTTTHSFDDGITRTEVTKEVKDGVTTKTVKTWTTRNASCITLSNGVKVALIAGAVVGFAKMQDVLVAFKDINHPDNEYYVRIFVSTFGKGRKFPEEDYAEAKAKANAKNIKNTAKEFAKECCESAKDYSENRLEDDLAKVSGTVKGYVEEFGK